MQGADDLRRIQDIDLAAEALAAQQQAEDAQAAAMHVGEEQDFQEDMEALQEVMGMPLPSVGTR